MNFERVEQQEGGSKGRRSNPNENRYKGNNDAHVMN